MAEARTNVLNVDPGCRADCAARLNWLFAFRTTAVIALIAPVPGSIETIAAAGSVRYGRMSLIALIAFRCRRGSIVV
jgi:hypothetical protein